MITNFLNNASKFTREGSIKLGWSYMPQTEEVEIYVEDTGIGIPQSEQKMIFGRFYKQNEFAQGTGLGLSICKLIIENFREGYRYGPKRAREATSPFSFLAKATYIKLYPPVSTKI